MPTKTARTRYVRFFPERVAFALDQLDDREALAWVRLTTAYAVADGALACDDKRLGLLTRTGKRWPDLRDKLIDLGLGRIEGGHWIDDDQQQSLEIQRRASERGQRGAAARFGPRRV